MKLEAFVPRSSSAFVFTVAMACYDRMIASFLGGIVYLFHFRPPPPSVWESRGLPVLGVISAVFVAPLLESCILIGIIELLRWGKSPVWVQVFVAAAALAGPHSFEWGPHAFVAMPDFAIQAAAYLYWRTTSRKKGFAVVAGIHALHNLIPAMSLLGNATRGV
jgi:hypothetical protein